MGGSLHPLALPFVLLPCVLGKVFTRCELVTELSQPRHRIPSDEVATWVCIVRHESEYNTSAIGNLNADGSGDHGLFQISDQYWCSPPGVGLACGLNCDQLEDDDIKDDVVCARRIYRAHKRRTGNGFTAWAVYGPHCRGDVSKYTADCDTTESPTSTTETTFQQTEGTTAVSSLKERKVQPHHTLKSSKYRPQYRTIPPHDQDVGRPLNTFRATSRTSGTSSMHRPTFTDPSLDSATVWMKIHNDPRFLNQFP